VLKHKDFKQDFSLKNDFSRRHLCPNPPALAGGRLKEKSRLMQAAEEKMKKANKVTQASKRVSKKK